MLPIDIKLNNNQIKQFSLALSIDDVLNCIRKDYDSYLNFLNEEFENNEMICEGDGANAILGSTEDPNSVAWLIQEIMNYLKVIGPFLILILSSIEFVRAILTSDDESLAKAQKNLISRLILAAALFLLPTLISVILNVFGITSNEICMF